MSGPWGHKLFPPPLKSINMVDEAEDLREVVTWEKQEFQENLSGRGKSCIFNFSYSTPRFIGANFYLLYFLHFSYFLEFLPKFSIF